MYLISNEINFNEIFDKFDEFYNGTNKIKKIKNKIKLISLNLNSNII